MKKVIISACGDRFETKFEDGTFFGKGLYPTEGGARKAVTRGGCTYDKPVEVKAPKATKKAKKAGKSGTDWNGLIDASGHGKNFWPAFHNGKAAVYGTYTSKHSVPEGYSLELCVELYEWAKASKGSFVKAEKPETAPIVLEPVAEVPVELLALEATIEKSVAQVSTWNHEAASEKARELGFEGKRAYRQLNKAFKAAPEGSQEKRGLKLARDICIRAATRAA